MHLLLDSKEIKPVNPKGSQPKYLLKVLILKLKLQYPSHMMQRSESLGKTLMLGKIEGRRRRGKQRMRFVSPVSEVGWYHQLNGHEFEQTLEESEGQGSLSCRSPWGRKVLGMTEQLNDSI